MMNHAMRRPIWYFIHQTTFSVALVLCIAHRLLAEDWNAEYQAKVRKLAEKNGEGIDMALAKRLIAMRETDQGIRKQWLAASEPQREALILEMRQIDKAQTEELKAIVAVKGWPTIAQVGLVASEAALIVLIHSPDHEFQRRLLPELQKLVEEEKIIASHVALVVDKLLVADGKPQRFGTQFDVREGKQVVKSVEEPDQLDARRAKYLLPPMEIYRKQMEEMYHIPLAPVQE